MPLKMNTVGVDKLVYQGMIALPRTQMSVGGWSANETENELSIALQTALRGQTSYRRYIDVECPDGTHVIYDQTGYCYNNDSPRFDEDWDEIYMYVPKHDGQYKLTAFVETADGRSESVLNEWPVNLPAIPTPELTNPVKRVFINGLLKASTIEITSQPVGGVIDDAGSLLMSVGVNELAGDITYQWWDDDYGEFNLLVGETSPTYLAGPLTSIGNRDSRNIYCRIHGFGGSTQFLDTSSASLTVNVRPANILSHPQSVIILDNETTTLSVAADGYGDSLSYYWKLNGANAPGDYRKSTYTFDPNGSTANVQIKCLVIRSGAPSVYTNEATVTVNASFAKTNTIFVSPSDNTGNPDTYGYSNGGWGAMTPSGLKLPGVPSNITWLAMASFSSNHDSTPYRGQLLYAHGTFVPTGAGIRLTFLNGKVFLFSQTSNSYGMVSYDIPAASKLEWYNHIQDVRHGRESGDFISSWI